MTLLTLDVECPSCRTRPNLRVFASLLELVRDADPSHELGTWECQGRVVSGRRTGPSCSTRVVITAGMIQRAAPLTRTGEGA